MPPLSRRDRWARWLWDRGGGLFLVTLALYLWLCPSYIVDGDNAEFCALGARGGIAHPSGFPLYVLYLRATAWLPGTGAHAAALATAILGAAQMWMLHAAARAWGARPAAASLAIAIVAGAPIVLRLNTEAEVFALAGLIAGAIVWLAAPAGPLRGVRRVAALGLVAGLGLSNNLLIVTLMPIGLWGAVRGVREAAGARLRAAVLGIVGLGVGLAPYAYLFVAPQTEVSWGPIDSASALLDHFLRRHYGGLRLGNFDETYSRSANLLEALRRLGSEWWWAPALLGLAAIGARVVRAGERSAAAALLASVLLAGPGIAVMANAAMTAATINITKMFALMILLLTVPVALGFEDVAAWLAARREIALRPALATALAFALLAASAGASLPGLARAQSPAFDHFARNTMTALPPDAVILASSDLFFDGTGYLQDVEGVRPDLTFVPYGGFATEPWFLQRIADRVGFDLIPADDPANPVAIGERALAHGRPLFVKLPLADLFVGHARYPSCLFMRVLPRGVAPPALPAVVAENMASFGRFDLHYAFPSYDDDWATNVHLRYKQFWNVLADALASAGLPSEDARVMAGYLAPRQ